jgi:hypothetical protein
MDDFDCFSEAMSDEMVCEATVDSAPVRDSKPRSRAPTLRIVSNCYRAPVAKRLSCHPRRARAPPLAA